MHRTKKTFASNADPRLSDRACIQISDAKYRPFGAVDREHLIRLLVPEVGIPTLLVVGLRPDCTTPMHTIVMDTIVATHLS